MKFALKQSLAAIKTESYSILLNLYYELQINR